MQLHQLLKLLENLESNIIAKKKAEQAKLKSDWEIAIKHEAVEAFRTISKQKGDLHLSAQDEKSILEYLLPILALGEKLSDYNSGPKATGRWRLQNFMGN